ncbi:Glutaredoxin-related protein 5, partial [Pteropus alecto]
SVGGSAEQLDALVKKDKVVVFLKGTPEQPQCGFSNAVVQILRLHGVSDYAAYNVLDDPQLRQGIKDYSNWPTIPQVYLNGEFVGGCDILLQMHQNGDLVEELKKLGIRSALLDETKDQDSNCAFASGGEVSAVLSGGEGPVGGSCRPARSELGEACRPENLRLASCAGVKQGDVVGSPPKNGIE